jgi:hypothetical protein
MASFESPVKLDPDIAYHLTHYRIYVFEASQFLNHFLKNGIFACRHCLYKTALPNIIHIYCLLKWNALTNDAFVQWNVFSFLFGIRGVEFYWTLKTSHNILINLVVKINNQYNIWRTQINKFNMYTKFM